MRKLSPSKTMIAKNVKMPKNSNNSSKNDKQTPSQKSSQSNSEILPLEKLTETQEKALRFIVGFLDEHQTSPTLREILDYMGYRSIGSVQDLIKALRKKSYLEEPDKQIARSIIATESARVLLGLTKTESLSKGSTKKIVEKIVNFADQMHELLTIPCLGSVPAGNPLEAIEEKVDEIVISKRQIKGGSKSGNQLFALRAKGESMIDAGILDGDWLIISSQKVADLGSIVVARLEEDATVKRLMKDKKGYYLKPENQSFQPIYASDTPFEVLGKVVALQRSI